jgi:hypothetical protein
VSGEEKRQRGKKSRRIAALERQMNEAIRRLANALDNPKPYAPAATVEDITLATQAADARVWNEINTIARLAVDIHSTEPPRPGRPAADNESTACAAIWLAYLAPQPAGAFGTLAAAAKALLDCTEPSIATVVAAGNSGKQPGKKALAERLARSTHRDAILAPEWRGISAADEWAEEVGLPTRDLRAFAHLAPSNVKFMDASRLDPGELTALRLARLVRPHLDKLPSDVATTVNEVLRLEEHEGGENHRK